MKLKQLIALVPLVVLVGLGAAPAQQPPASQPSASAAAAPSAIEVRALQEFGRGNWAGALPMLQKVQEELKTQNQSDRLGAIEENIRVCQRNLAAAASAQANSQAGATGQPAGPAAGPAAAPADPAQAGPPSGDNRKPHPAPKSGEVQEMSIKDLGNFEYDADKGGNIPDDVKHLSGATLRLSGFMIPMDQADNITQFALVPSLFACCFGQPPQVQHTIVVHVPKGKAVSYYPDEILVEGKLSVEEKKEDGFIVSIFEMECSSVKPSVK